MSIKAVLFDFDGTLRLNKVPSDEILSGFVKTKNFPCSEEDIRRAGRWENYYWAQSRELLADVQKFEFGTDRFWRNYARRRLAAFGLPPSLAAELAEEASQYMVSRFTRESILPEGVHSALADLKARGYILGIYSNRREEYDHEVAALGLSEYFDFALAAGTLKSWKPDPEGFWHALERAGISPQEGVYVGDNYFADVVGARRVGMHPVLYNVRHLFECVDCDEICAYDQLVPVVEAKNVPGR